MKNGRESRLTWYADFADSCVFPSLVQAVPSVSGLRPHLGLNAATRILDGVEEIAALEGPPDLACPGENIVGTAKVSVMDDVLLALYTGINRETMSSSKVIETKRLTGKRNRCIVNTLINTIIVDCLFSEFTRSALGRQSAETCQ